ncbi:MAG: hypothetical protein CVV49_13385, partial [Spirochaetae bacterium HGW-Spirochaetae-5]
FFKLSSSANITTVSFLSILLKSFFNADFTKILRLWKFIMFSALYTQNKGLKSPVLKHIFLFNNSHLFSNKNRPKKINFQP